MVRSYIVAVLLISLVVSCAQPCMTITENRYKNFEAIPQAPGWIEDQGCQIYNPYPDSGESISYEGGCRDNYADGYGKVIWRKLGRVTEQYTGEFVRGKYHGKGILIKRRGSYEGQFKNHLEHGLGSYLDSSDQSIYIGYFWEGQRDGTGSIDYPNGDSYQGYFLKGMRSNDGVYKWRNGDSYHGTYRYGSRNGDGVYYWVNGDSVRLKYERGELLTKLPQSKVIQGEFRVEENKAHIQTPPVLSKKVQPEYPCDAKMLGMEGKVALRVLIDEKGFPIKYSIVETDGDTFSAASVNAIMRFRFKPALLDGKPVRVWILYPFTFRLKN